MSDQLRKLSARSFKTGCQSYGRIGHRTILIDSHILVFGGINYHNDFVTEILNINCESYEVSNVHIKNSVPVQSFTLHEYNNKIYLWGGRRPSGASDELWKFQNDLFTKIMQKGTIPKPRYCQSSVLFHKRYAIIYGGMNENEIFNDWFMLDLETYEWTKLDFNLYLPPNLQPKMVWLDTRGVLLVSQIFNEETSCIQPCFQLYEFKIRRNEHHFHVVIEPIQIQFQQHMIHRGFSTICKYNLDTLNLAIIGGINVAQDQNEMGPQMFSDSWFVNLETFECHRVPDVQLTSKFGHQAIFYKDRILLIGGVISVGQFASCLQTIDFNLKNISIDRKLCQSCRCVYGLEDYTKHKFSIKCEYDQTSKSHIPAKLVKKIAQMIRNPIQAFGLLVDNCLNMNANLIEIDFIQVELQDKIYKNPHQTILKLTDNSYGFSKEEILESLFTFGYKIETSSHDSKFQQELAVRKQYGLNLKLACMRLGKSCLIVTNTIQDQKFIGYFSIDSTNCPQFKDRFTCFYYFINQDKFISSEVNRHIIRKNVQHLIDIDQIQQSTSMMNKIFVTDFNHRGQFIFSQDKKNLICHDFQEDGVYFDHLRQYLKSLYLKPFFGRTIKLCKQIIYCVSMAQKFKKDETDGKISKIDLIKYSNPVSNFQVICLYDVVDKNYAHKSVMIYSSNRLVTSFNFANQNLCGFIELKPEIQITIGKSSIQSQIQERQLKKYLIKLKEQIKSKRNYQSLSNCIEDSISKLQKARKKIK